VLFVHLEVVFIDQFDLVMFVEKVELVVQVEPTMFFGQDI